MAETKHAVLGPSKADTWMTCLGSTEAQDGIPNITSEYAEEGTDHHEVAAVCLEENLQAESLVGRPMLSGAVLTEENAAFVQNYVDFVRSHKDEDGILLVEEAVPLTQLTGEPDATGTSDAVVLRADRELFVGDLKFGRGVQVSPVQNRQAMMYALGVIEKHQVQDDYDTVRIAISQPRNGGNSDWVVPMAELLAFGETVKATAKRVSYLDPASGVWTLTTGLPRTPSDKACQFCRAKATCQELTNLVVNHMTTGFEILDPPPVTKTEFVVMTDAVESMQTSDRLGRFMAIADLAEMWIKAVRGATEVELLAGRPVTGFKLVQGKKGNRKWTDESCVEATLKKFRLKRDEMYNFSLISPTDAEKLLAKTSPKRWEEVKTLYAQADGAIHVATLDDKRPEYVPEKAEDGFEALTNETMADTGEDLA